MEEYVSISEHKEYVRRMEQENERQNHRLTNLEKALDQIQTLTTSIEKLATHMEYMSKEQAEQGERLKALEGRDGEKWRSIASHVTFSIISLVLGFLASKLGL